MPSWKRILFAEDLGDITVTKLTIGDAEITEAELEILDGATVTTAELNILDGATADKNELNISIPSQIMNAYLKRGKNGTSWMNAYERK